MATDLFAAYQAAMGEAVKGAPDKEKKQAAPSQKGDGVDLFEAIGFTPKPRMDRTWGEAAADTGAQLAEGANNIVGAIPSLIAPDSGIAQSLKDGAEYWRDKQSMPMQRRMTQTEQKIAEANPDSIIDQGVAAGKAYLSDPAMMARLVATNLPSMVIGAGAAKGAQVAGMAAGATRAAAAAGATTASGVTNATLNAGGARGEAYDTIYRAAKEKGYTDEQARAVALEDSKLPAVVGAVTGFISGRSGLEKAVVNKGLAQGGVKAAAKAVGTELLGEQLEEVAPQFATNIQAENYDGRSFARDIGRTAVETAVASGPGAVIAGVGEGLNKEEAAPAAAPGTQPVQPGTSPQNVPAPQAAPAAAPGAVGAQAAAQQTDVSTDQSTQERDSQAPDGDPLGMSEAAASQRMAELEVMDSTTGLNADQQREKLMLAHRLDELAAHADELENIGEVAGTAEDKGAAPADDDNYMIDHDEVSQKSEPMGVASIKAKTWPQFVNERGYNIEQLRKGTADWNTLQTEWAAVKTHRAGLQLDGNGSTAAPVNEIQNRDRSRPASVAQMQTMAQKPDYMRLGPSRTPESGAPMVFAEGDQMHAAVATGASDFAVMSDGQRVPFQYAVMEAADVQPSNFADGSVNPSFDSKHPGTVKALNNGRTAGLRGGTAEGYKQELVGDSAVHGIDPAVIEGMQSPMLVRLYSEQDNRHNMGVKSQSQALGLSAAEQAATDAQLMDTGMLDMFDSGGLDGQGNRDFVRGFIHRLQQAGQDVAEMMDAGGKISPKGVQRLQAAMVHKAFDDGDLVETMFGSQDNDVRAIGEALKEVAGEWAHMRHMASTGAINAETDLTPNLLQAIRLVQKARRDRSALVDLVNQVDIESGDVVADMTTGMLRLLYSGEHLTRARGRDAIAQGLRDYMGAALSTSASGSDMFGESVGPAEIVAALTGQAVSEQTQQQTQAQTAQENQSNDNAKQADDGQGKPTSGQPAGGSADPAEQQHGRQGPEAASEPTDAGGEVGQDAQAQSKQQDSQGAEGDQEDGRSSVSEPEPLALQGYTADELRQQEQEKQQAAEAKAKADAEADKKAQAERDKKEIDARQAASAENFQLGQDAHDALAGQGSIFDAPAAPEKAKNPNDFIEAPGGGKDFGAITPEQGRAMRRQAGPIRLQEGVQNSNGTGYGLRHIEANHGKQIRGSGFDSVAAFVKHVAENFSSVHKANGIQLLASVQKGKKEVMFVQLAMADGEDFYRVNTAFPVSGDYIERQEKKGMKLLWDGREPASSASGEQTPYASTTGIKTSPEASTAKGQSADSVALAAETATQQPSDDALNAMFDELMAEEYGQAQQEQEPDDGRPSEGDVVQLGGGLLEVTVKTVRADGTVVVEPPSGNLRAMPLAKFLSEKAAAEKAKASKKASKEETTITAKLLGMAKRGIAYVDLATGQTWTGRGKAPAWVRDENLTPKLEFNIQEQLRREYFKPGAIVKSYGGFDEVISYQPQTADKSWSVTVHEVQKKDGEWARVDGVGNRTHHTQPDVRELQAGAVDRGAGEALASAAGNVATGLVNAIDGLGALFGGAGKLGSGLSFDEQTYAKAKPLFDQALANMKDASKDLREAMRAIIRMVGDKFGADAVRNMQPYVVQYIKDMSIQAAADKQAQESKQGQKEEKNVSSAADSVERDSRKPAAVSSDGGAIQGDAANAAKTDSQAPGQASGASGTGQRNDSGVSVDSAALAGKRGDQRLHSGSPAPGLEGSSTGADILEGMPAAGSAGVSFEPATTAELAGIANAANAKDQQRSDARKQVSKRKPEEDVVYELGSEDHAQSVRDAIPQLLPGQVDDVVKAEKAYSAPDGHGMLLTNGTGTGKTFSGLGVIRRFVDQDKGNVLVVVPDDKIASDWIRSGKVVGLDIHQLESTKDAGKGVTLTTYANLGENNALASRHWDLVVPDEAHSLMSSQDASPTLALSAIRGLTFSPRGVWARMAMVHAKDYEQSASLQHRIKDAIGLGEMPAARKLEEELKALNAKLDAARKEMEKEFAEAGQNGKRTKMLALSATPFAYDKNIDWADGYLFSYDEGRADESKDFRGYNVGGNREQFFMQHFGYRMRYNKLTAPEAGVDRNLMERQFNTWLKQRGVLSTRMLDVPADYDRRFVLIESAIGNRIDEALQYLADQRSTVPGFNELSDLVNKQLDYQTRRYLLEAIKAQEAVGIARAHMAMGRKVVVFHDFIKGGGTNPFDISARDVPAEKQEDVAAAIRQFNQEFGDLQRANLHLMPSPVTLFKKEFPDLLLVNGQVKPKRSVLQAYTDFNDDSKGPQVMLVQSAKDKGWSGHDTTGKYQRVLINLGLPTAPTKASQQEGRIYRTGQVSDAIIRYLNTGTSWERTAFASTIATRAATAENLAMGELARSLQDSFVQAFEEADAWEPGHDGEGKGGKEQDRARNNVVSEWDRAKTLYWAQQKKTSKTKAMEGADYFATPEPLGLKMVEWGGVVAGEDAMEPSAGHGAIARWLPSTSRRTMVEPSPVLRSRLALVGFKDSDRIVAGTFEELDIGNKYDVVTMNPPFGTASRTAVDHIAKAYRHLREGGRLVALLPAGPAADKKLEAWLYERGDKADKDGYVPFSKPELHRAADILLPGLAFGRAGTQVATRVVIIDKLAKDSEPTAAHRSVDLTNAADINELFERLEHIEMPKRAKQLAAEKELRDEIRAAAAMPNIQRAPGTEQAPEPAAAAPVKAKDDSAMLAQEGRPFVRHVTMKGKSLRGIIFMGTKADAMQYDPYTLAKDGGWFIRERHVTPDPEKPAFRRETQAQPVAFARKPSEADLHWRNQSARVVVDSMMAKWGNPLPVHVARNMQDAVIPQAVRAYDQQLKDQGATGEPVGFIYAGSVYVLSDMLPTHAAVAETLAHEMLGHAGLRGHFGDKLDAVLRQIADTRPKDMRRIADDYGLDLSKEGDRLQAAEEVLAFMAQTQPTLGFVKRAIGAIKAWLRANVPGLESMAMSDEEMILKYILPARAFIENKASTRQSTPQDPAFMRVSVAAGAQAAQKTLGQLQQRVKDLSGYESWDSLIYAWQDRFIDLKRIQQRIKDLNGTVNETNDAYQGEELYHKRVAKRAANFLRDELRPLLAGLNKAGVQIEEFERFLHARHAQEANAVMAERNPNQQTIDTELAKADAELQQLRLDLQKATAKGQALAPIQKAIAAAHAAVARWDGAEAFRGTEAERLALSGMTDQEAQNILTGYPADKRAKLDALANQVDAINEGTLQTLDSYGLMEQKTLQAWRDTYKHYVPLHRDEAHPDSKAHPIGQGFSTRGDAAKQRTGSNEKVTNILSHIAMQREAAITRGEKNNVAKRLYVLAAQNPDPDLWTLDLPKKKAIDPDTGLVRTMVDRAAALKDNVLMVRIGGHDKHLIFNEKNEQALRLGVAMRNLDATELDRFTRLMGKLTRWFAAVNTQYNPVFSMFNFARDIQGAMLQLSTTPLAGQEAQVLKNVGANIRSIYRELRNERGGKALGTGRWAQAWEQLQMDGGMTGFRELYSNPKDRAEALQSAIRDMALKPGARRGFKAMLGWLSDFNETAEGTTRLAVYQVALDKGLSRQEAASIAKNITVNFNRRGRNTSVVGSYYAFMNAAIQGNVRMYETLTGPRGRKIIIGGVLLGMASALMGHFVMGGDGADDEWARVPEFVKERNIVIPLGHKDYVTIPMPLGFHVFPNIGRKMVEMVTNTDPHKGRMARVGELALIAVNAYNPLGGTENMMQMLAPTPFDPVAALMENKDWTGRPIYKEQRSNLDPKPGHTMAKDSTSQAARWAAQFANYATGGNDWRPGAWSPNPDAIEYLFGQFTGGVGRELAKVGNVARSMKTGDELASHQIPIVGRMYGSTSGINGQSETFYSNIQRINVAMNEAKGRVEQGEDAEALLAELPLAKLDTGAGLVEKRVRELTKMRNAVQKGDSPEKSELVKQINQEIEATMYRLNAAAVEAIQAAKNRGE